MCDNCHKQIIEIEKFEDIGFIGWREEVGEHACKKLNIKLE